jgi:hypothetical protein
MPRKIERIMRKMTDKERSEMLKATREIAKERSAIAREAEEAEPSRTIRIRVTEEMHAALKEFCDRTGEELSAILRGSALRYIGRRDLVGTMPSPGRPPRVN